MAVRRAVEDAPPLQLGDHAQDGQHHFREVAGRVDIGFRERAQPGAGLLHLPGQHKEVSRVPGQPVGGRRHDEVARDKNLEEALQLRPVRGGAAEGVGEHPGAAGRLQLPPLDSEVLAFRRHPRIAVNHAPIVHRNCAPRKLNYFSGRKAGA